MRRQFSVYFYCLKIGTKFYRNGNTWIKKSTRTAHLVEFNRRFYFGQNDVCIINGPYEDKLV